MSETGKRLYWIKLREDFFNQKEIRLMRSQENGADYVILWQQLLLLSATGIEPGVIRFNERKPYTSQMLAAICDSNVDIVRAGLQLFQNLELIEIEQDGTMYITGYDLPNLIGSETDYAQRKRDYRKRLEEYKQLGWDNVPKMSLQSKIKIKKKDSERDQDTRRDQDKNTAPDGAGASPLPSPSPGDGRARALDKRELTPREVEERMRQVKEELRSMKGKKGKTS